MKDKNPKVSIIILNWNGWEDTIECLESLYKITYPNYEVIVVDNGSTNDSLKQIKKVINKNNTRIIENKENLGFAEGNNVAMREVMKVGKSKYVLLLNNDTVVDKEFLSELVKTGESDEKVGIVGSILYYYDEPDKIWRSGGKMNWLTGKPNHIFRDYKDKEKISIESKVEHVVGCSFLIKLDILKKIGLLDKLYFCYFEETDLCIKANKLDYRVYLNTKSKVWHKVSKSSTKEFQEYYFSRNKVIFMMRYSKLPNLIFFILYKIIIQNILAPFYFSLKLKNIKKGLLVSKSFIKGSIDGLRISLT